MKCLKAIGLAAVAGMALTAILGASPASATVLCTATETPCSEAHKISKTTDKWLHTVIEGNSSAYFLSTSGEGSTTVNPLVTCTGSTVTAESEGTGSATETEKGVVKKEWLAFSGCTHTTDVLAGGTLEVHFAEGDNGTVTSKEAVVSLNILGVNCIYGSRNGVDIGTLTGGSMATMDIRGVLLLEIESSILCPKTVIWEGSYTVTEPEPLYVEPS